MLQADVTDFELPGRPQVGLAVSTMDALNHLPGEARLAACFRLVSGTLAPGGLFVFDLLTKDGLADDNKPGATVLPDSAVVSRGVYLEETGRSHNRVTGFLRRADGLYERFDMNTSRCEFAPDRVRELLAEVGFGQVHVADVTDLATPSDAVLVLRGAPGTLEQEARDDRLQRAIDIPARRKRRLDF